MNYEAAKQKLKKLSEAGSILDEFEPFVSDDPYSVVSLAYNSPKIPRWLRHLRQYEMEKNRR